LCVSLSEVNIQQTRQPETSKCNRARRKKALESFKKLEKALAPSRRSMARGGDTHYPLYPYQCTKPHFYCAFVRSHLYPYPYHLWGPVPTRGCGVCSGGLWAALQPATVVALWTQGVAPGHRVVEQSAVRARFDCAVWIIVTRAVLVISTGVKEN